jgi:hypothetical protein
MILIAVILFLIVLALSFMLFHMKLTLKASVIGVLNFYTKHLGQRKPSKDEIKPYIDEAIKETIKDTYKIGHLSEKKYCEAARKARTRQ